MTNKYMYFVANWKMFGNFKSLNQLDKVMTFVKKFKIKPHLKNKLQHIKHVSLFISLIIIQQDALYAVVRQIIIKTKLLS